MLPQESLYRSKTELLIHVRWHTAFSHSCFRYCFLCGVDVSSSEPGTYKNLPAGVLADVRLPGGCLSTAGIAATGEQFFQAINIFTLLPVYGIVFPIF